MRNIPIDRLSIRALYDQARHARKRNVLDGKRLKKGPLVPRRLEPIPGKLLCDIVTGSASPGRNRIAPQIGRPGQRFDASLDRIDVQG
jgi:hypothetical protein